MATIRLPDYAFGSMMGKPFRWFAWRPVKLYYGRWVWARKVWKIRIQKHGYLDDPDWGFWVYSDVEGEIDAHSPSIEE